MITIREYAEEDKRQIREFIKSANRAATHTFSRPARRRKNARASARGGRKKLMSPSRVEKIVGTFYIKENQPDSVLQRRSYGRARSERQSNRQADGGNFFEKIKALRLTSRDAVQFRRETRAVMESVSGLSEQVRTVCGSGWFNADH